ncbi:MAG: sulfotransferase family protein [Spirochaetaceae bacterium]
MSRIHQAVTRNLRRARASVYGHYDCKTIIIALHREQALYFAVPKVANTSIKKLLTGVIEARLPADVAERVAGGPQLFRGKGRRAEMRDLQYLLCKHEVPRYRHYYSFAFVRNPWDRLVSCYMDKVAETDLEDEDLNPKSAAVFMRQHGGKTGEVSFEEFAREVCRTPDAESNRHFRSQHVFLTDRRGRLLPEHIFRFETLAEDFATVMQRIGLPGLELPHANRTQRRDYRDYYTDELRDLVAERYRRDIEVFGFEFPE